MLSGNIAATSLKILRKELYSVKCYAKSNLNVFTIKSMGNFSAGLNLFYSKGLKCHPNLAADDAFKFCCSLMKPNKARYFM